MCPKLNAIYISAQLSEKLRDIPTFPITCITAPVGYGKTTAARWWSEQYGKSHARAVILHQSILSDNLQDFWGGFCHVLREYPEFCAAMRGLGFPDNKRAQLMFLELVENALFCLKQEVFYIIDDLHLIEPAVFREFLFFLAEHLPQSLHLVLVSRNRVFSRRETLKFGSRLFELTASDLRLQEEDIREYARRCGLHLACGEADALFRSSEGWISLLYLNFHTYCQSKTWLSESPAINTVMEEALLAPLPAREQEFLILMGVPDEFTSEQAAWLWNDSDTDAILTRLTQQNAFITTADGYTFRYHNMLRQCTRQKFARLPLQTRVAYQIRLGDWYMRTGEYFNAALCYAEHGEYEKFLCVLVLDRAISFNGSNQDKLLKWSRACPPDILKKNPTAALVMMRKLFSFRQVEEMIRLRGIFLEGLAEDKSLSEAERNNYLGECEMVMSFLDYNDISAMSIHHRKASEMMNRPVRNIDPNGLWTFGSPSVLMMFHRKCGALDAENAAMSDCMPYYYRITEHHGCGAEYVMAGETAFLRGNLTEAEIACKTGRLMAKRHQQYSVLLVAEFLSMRLAVFRGDLKAVLALISDQQKLLHREKRFVLVYTLEMCQAWLYALLREEHDIPDWLSDDTVVFSGLLPAIPMLELVRNQVLLAKENWAEVIARESAFRALCDNYHYLLGTVYLEIHLSAAYDRMGKRRDAMAHLRAALELAIPDGLLMPFVENSDFVSIQLRELLPEGAWGHEISSILTLTDRFREARNRIKREFHRGTQDYGLTRRELEVAQLAAVRKRNREIAEALSITEGSVKQRLNAVYDKLGIGGNEKNKRGALEKLFAGNDSSNL